MKNKSKLTPSRDLQRVDIDMLRPDPENVRRTYDADGLSELAESLAQEGLLQNLEAGPDGTVHIGNRRLLALTRMVLPDLDRAIADCESAAVKWDADGRKDEAASERKLAAKKREQREDLSRPHVRVLTAEEAVAARIRQLIENLQREDVTAYDEAVGYAKLLEMTDAGGVTLHTPESIARRIGKGRTAEYVRKRLRVRRSPKRLLEALECGRVGVRVVEIVCRIPGASDRDEAAKRVLEPKLLDRPLTESETADLVRQEYMISLRGAPFDQEDPALTPATGPCGKCPRKSGNDPTLAAEMGAGPARGIPQDLCTDPGCFRNKTAAAWEIKAEGIRAGGGKVLSEAESAKLFCGPDQTLPTNSVYVSLDEKPGPRDVGHFAMGKVQTWRELLAGTEIQRVTCRHPRTGRVVELVERPAAKTAVEVVAAEQGRESVFATEPENAEAVRAEKAAERRTERIDRAVAIRLVDHLADKLAPAAGLKIPKELAGPDLSAAVEELLARAGLPIQVLWKTLEIVLSATADGCQFFADWLESDKPGPGASGRDFLPVLMDRFLAREPAMCAREICGLIALAAVAPGARVRGEIDPDLVDLCQCAGIDPRAKACKFRKEMANEAYEARTEKGEKVTVSAIEAEYGVAKGALAKWRKSLEVK